MNTYITGILSSYFLKNNTDELLEAIPLLCEAEEKGPSQGRGMNQRSFPPAAQALRTVGFSPGAPSCSSRAGACLRAAWGPHRSDCLLWEALVLAHIASFLWFLSCTGDSSCAWPGFQTSACSSADSEWCWPFWGLDVRVSENFICGCCSLMANNKHLLNSRSVQHPQVLLITVRKCFSVPQQASQDVHCLILQGVLLRRY